MRRLVGIFWSASCLVPSLVLAQAAATPPAPAPDTPQIKLGAEVFYDYTARTSPDDKDADGNTITPNAFDVKRAYLNVFGTISKVVAFRITPDIVRDTTPGSTLNGSLTFRIKYAYGQFNLDQWTGNWKDTFVRVGVQQTPFISFEESIYRYRFQGATFVEREEATASADAGASFHTSLPNGYGEIHGGVYNGEGFQRAEVNGQKAFAVRGTLRPFAGAGHAARGLLVTGFYDADHYQKNAPRTRLVANLAFEQTHFNFGFDYLRMTDQPSAFSSSIEGHGWSVFLTPFLREKGRGLEGLLRFDRYTPNLNNSSQEKQRTIAGVAYWFPHPGGSATAALLFDFDQLKFSGFPSSIPANRTQQQIGVHGLISF